MTPEQIEQLQTKGICSFFIRNISKICGENEKNWSVIWQIPTHTCTYINKHSAVCTKSTHIYIIILCTHVYVLYTCTKKSEGPLLRMNYWNYFFTKVFNKQLQAFLYHEQLLWTVEEHHITSYEFFVSQQINSAIAVHLTPIKGQKKGTLLKNQINFCSDTCLYDGKRNSL